MLRALSLVFTSLIFFPNFSYAGLEDALRLRHKIELPPSLSEQFLPIRGWRAPHHSIKLPISGTQGQGKSEFCWVFAALSMLESHFLSDNPGTDPHEVLLSRWAFTEVTEKGAFTKGTSIDAIDFYSRKSGLVAFRDYKDNGIPEVTTYLGHQMTPLELRGFIMNGQTFWSYAFSEKLQGWKQHPDRDALAGTLSLYLAPEQRTAIINKSLQRGRAIEMTACGHSTIIYGADYDENGIMTKLYIKDSINPYLYEADPKEYIPIILEMTTVSNLSN